MLSILMETWLGFVVASTCTHSHLKVSEFQGTGSLPPEWWWVTGHGQQWDAHCAGLKNRRGQTRRRTELKCEHLSSVTCFQLERFLTDMFTVHLQVHSVFPTFSQ